MSSTLLKTKEINLMNDALAKSIIRSKEAREEVIGFLSGITHIPKRKFKNALFVGGEIPKNNKQEKGKISDVMCILKDVIIIIEINDSYYQNLFPKNSLYSYATLVSATPVNTEVYKKVILVNIDSFNHFKVKEPVLTFTTSCKELKEHDLYTSYHVILENITDTNYNIDKEVRKFGKFLGLKLSIEELKEKYREDGKYMNIVKKVEKFMRDNNLVQYYDLEASHQYEIKDSYDTGVREGRTSGLAEGRQEGLKTRSAEIAKNLLNLNIDIPTIMKSTGLTKQEIMKLQ